MAKYSMNTEAEVIAFGEQTPPVQLAVADIIVHKEAEFYMIQGWIKQHLGDYELFPASPGTEVYAINGFNTSVVKGIPD